VNEVVAALANPLKNPLEILSTNQISAKYGKEIVRQGVTAALAGLALTLIFILLYYRFAGIVALLGSRSTFSFSSVRWRCLERPSPFPVSLASFSPSVSR
ncbi:hypothetical protein N8580_02670, partial [Akkermansiaceae bacterium]|nr:hypothetical protein [Akkermansiaceae bacterium]